MAIVVAEVVNVLVLAGFPQTRLKESGFIGKFKERLVMIVKVALRIHEAIGEGITSGDIRTLVVPLGEAFHPQFMDDAFSENTLANAREAPGQQIIGTTDIGLQRVTRGSASNILKKPKVVLSSALEV